MKEGMPLVLQLIENFARSEEQGSKVSPTQQKAILRKIYYRRIKYIQVSLQLLDKQIQALFILFLRRC
jgi:hypothetical protein